MISPEAATTASTQRTNRKPAMASAPPRATPWLPILGYHRVVETMPPDDACWLCVPRHEFERQLAWFARLGYRTISLDTVGELLARNQPIPPRRFAITFDDGYLDNLSVAAPVLSWFGFSATVYMVAARIGGTNIWDPHASCAAPLMDWQHLRAWRALGHAVGSHTLTHPHLSTLRPDAARRELVDSRRTLEDGLGEAVPTFCYPYGDWSATTVALAEEAGYTLACNDVARREHGRYTMARTDPRCWPAALTLVSGQPWFAVLNQHGLLRLPRWGLHQLWQYRIVATPRRAAHGSENLR
ncbi:MAG TPA: polysaccharide deacetylase family protein [Ktedonobacterales bacterium]|nr:polysaccharide deacetylase family protein [Ktedonobacterales bacterium]